MRSYLVLTENGPLLLLTSMNSITEETLLDSLRGKGIDKFIAYEVPVDKVHEFYGVPFEIIAADLARSGRFAPTAEQDLISRPSEIAQVRFQDWRTLGVDNLVIGKVESLGAGQFRVQFRVFDVFRGRQVTGYSLPASSDNLRHVAHRIADIIYEKLTGEPGAFASRIAYVISESRNGQKEYQLQLADSDGYNPRQLLTSPQPLMSPAWSPDGRKLAYVSFENERASVFVQDIGTGVRNGNLLVFDEMIITSGTGFGTAFNPDDVVRQVWGKITFDFTDCNNLIAIVDAQLPEFSDIGLDQIKLIPGNCP